MFNRIVEATFILAMATVSLCVNVAQAEHVATDGPAGVRFYAFIETAYAHVRGDAQTGLGGRACVQKFAGVLIAES